MRRTGPLVTVSDDAALIDRAVAAQAVAYAPYSHFQVGAVVMTASGHVFTGCNVENASLGLTICAERAAICAAIAAGERDIVLVVVSTDAPTPAAPCGACRQVLHEFGPTMRVIAVTTAGERWEATLDALLPRSFGPDNLARERG